MTEIAAKREAMTEAERRAYPERVRAYNEAQLAEAQIAHAPEPPAPAGPPWRERVQMRADRQALDAEQMKHPEGSPVALAINDDKIALENEWAAKQPAQPKPGEITWDDVPRAPSLRDWSAAHRSELVQRMKLAGVSPQEAILVGAEIETLRQLRPRAWEREPVEYDEPTRAAAERALAVLYPSAAEREAVAEDGLWNAGGERLVGALAELDRRRRAAR